MEKQRILLNPLNLAYKYQHYGKAAHREAADPTLILFKGRYYLFASMSGGFYHSKDLLNWEWHENRKLELYRYAPDVRQIGCDLIFCASSRSENSAFYRTQDPLSDQFEKVSEPFAFWDPDLFQDDDGRVYLYWGCDAGKPIYGQELDPRTLLPIGERKELIFARKEEHGWERQEFPGRTREKQSVGMKLLYMMMALSGRKADDPFIEGAYMNKFDGRYYLQYAAPATEIATYADGVYVGAHPLGPFVYQSSNPFSSKPGGFITGAGHGSTIEDECGNLWHSSTMRISVNAGFERRVGLFPAGLDRDGVLFCNQNYADWPLQIPEGRFDPWDIRPNWMLLSYRKHAEASSSLPDHQPVFALDEDICTCWCACSTQAWYLLDLGKNCDVRAVQINFADVGVPLLRKPRTECSDLQTNRRYIDTDPSLFTRWLLEASTDGVKWTVVEDKRRASSDFAHDCVYPERLKSRYLRLTVTELPYGKKCALSGLRVFGEPVGPVPELVEQAACIPVDTMSVRLTWPSSRNALGYLVRYGVAPEKLYLSHMVYGKNEALLTTLNQGQDYWYCIDSFGEGGIQTGTIQKMTGGKQK